jgi:hypothetical protein
MNRSQSRSRFLIDAFLGSEFSLDIGYRCLSRSRSFSSDITNLCLPRGRSFSSDIKNRQNGAFSP